MVDRATWQADLDQLLVREKAHTRGGDKIAAARRRLPMVEVDPTIQLVGTQGSVPLLDERHSPLSIKHVKIIGRVLCMIDIGTFAPRALISHICLLHFTDSVPMLMLKGR